MKTLFLSASLILLQIVVHAGIPQLIGYGITATTTTCQLKISFTPQTVFPITITGALWYNPGTFIDSLPPMFVDSNLGTVTFYNLSPSTDYVAKVSMTNSEGTNDMGMLFFTTRDAVEVPIITSDAVWVGSSEKQMKVHTTDRFIDGSVTISNMLGQAVLTRKLDSEDDTIDASLIASGMYFITLTKGREQYSRKIIF